MDTFNLFKTDGEVVLNIIRIFCIVSQLVVVMPCKIFFCNTILLVEFPAFVAPVLEDFVISTGFAEVFHFHLFKFAGTENKVLEDDFIAE